jgi:hypothetical protein
MPFESSDGTASVRFRSADQGFAGSYSNGLKQTTDGGRSWTSLVTPADELCPPNPESTEEIPEPLPMQGKDGKSVWRSFSGDQDSRVDCLQIIGDRLLVRQREQVFERPLSSRGGWRLLEVDGRRIVSAVPNEDGLVVVTEDRRVALLARDLLSLYPS